MAEFEDSRLRAHLEQEIATALDKFLNQDPCPSPLIIADFFGQYDLVKRHRRGAGVEIHIPDLKDALVEQLMVKYRESGNYPGLQGFKLNELPVVLPQE